MSGFCRSMSVETRVCRGVDGLPSEGAKAGCVGSGDGGTSLAVGKDVRLPLGEEEPQGEAPTS